jgi:radical SAM protein with 4Fe4S-binding SPASM domain
MKVRDAYALSNLLIDLGVHELDILGGEPLLLPWIKDFVNDVTDSGLIINLSTNGGLPDIIYRLSEVGTDLMNVGFSLHGFSGTHNALTQADNFSKTVEGIKRMVRAGKNPIVKSVLMRVNMTQIYDLVDYLKNLGVKRYFLLHEDLVGRQNFSSCFSFPEFREFHEKLNEAFDIGFVAASGFFKRGINAPGRCDAGTKKIAIMPDGSAFPCNLFAGFREFRLGNVFTDGIEKIWRNPILEHFRHLDGNGRCKKSDCRHHSACRGGCPAHSFSFYGTLDAVDPRCSNR